MSIERNVEEYIGDGLYTRCDGYVVVLRAPREGGDHEVHIEPATWKNLRRWLASDPRLAERFR